MTNTTLPTRKKLIEVSIPLEAINAASAREKSIRHGHPSTLHLWWARRPLAACRAVLFAQLVDDPSAWPEKFPTEEAQAEERKRLHDVIARIVPWEASNDEVILNEARWEIARSVAWGLGEEPPPKEQPAAVLDYLQTKAPPVYDPFSGGGSIPLEAQRLGLRAHGSDLNPVAVLIGKALVEIPPKFAGRPPINPKVQGDRRLVGKTWRGAQGLADDVRWYGRWIRDEAERRVGHAYPKAKLLDGSQATVIAWLWARTVRSPDPAAKGARVPLVSTWLLSTKAGRKAWAEPVLDPAEPDGYRFEVHTGALSKADEERLKKGTKAAKGQAFICVLTGSPIERSYIQIEGKADRLGARILALVVEGERQRIYLSPNIEHEQIAHDTESWPGVAEARTDFLSAPTPTRAMITGGVCSAYGLRTWGHLFTPRQLVALTTLSGLIGEARARVLADACLAGVPDDNTPLSEGGTGAQAYADAVATYLAFALSKLADRGSSICTWFTERDSTRPTFARQAIPMTWDFAELNTLLKGTGSFLGAVEWTAESFEDQCSFVGDCSVRNIDASRNLFSIRPVVISTDPPYYDNIGYADLSDFFYVWLRRSLYGVWPDLFRRITAPKERELVATPYRFPDGATPEWVREQPDLEARWASMSPKERAEAFFMTGMGEALAAMRRAAAEEVPLTIYYAFKQSELAQEGVTSAGWATFLQAIIDAGLAVDGTWPIRTELANRMIGRDANALASSIVLVCRKRSDIASVITRAEFLRELRRELPLSMKEIIAARVGPVDFEQAVIGPGMGVFSRHAKVQEDDDSPMSVKTALALINRVRLEVDAETGNFDPETQVALTWFKSYGYIAHTSGEAILLANAKGVSLDALLSSSVFRNGQGKVRLVKREELQEDWSPATDKNLTIWECVQHTARALDQGGSTAAAVLIKAIGGRAEDALSLAYRLYDIANAKGEASEARVYAELAAEWPDLEAHAANLDDAVLPKTGPAQASLFG